MTPQETPLISNQNKQTYMKQEAKKIGVNLQNNHIRQFSNTHRSIYLIQKKNYVNFVISRKK